MGIRYHLLLMLLMLFTFSRSSSEEVSESGDFVEVLKATGTLLKYCWIKASKTDGDVVDGVQVCLRRASLLALDRIIEDDVVELPYGMRLVKIENNSDTLTYKRDVEKLEAGSDREWSLQVIARIESIFKTHALHLPTIANNEIVEGRGRRKNNNDIVLFGVLAMTIIAIPLGFQFLAVLGGKALLLAKLALILTSIQGLKKIATSDLHYGFYSTAGHGGGGPPSLGGLGGLGGKPWFYDRKWQQNLPERHTFDSYSDLPDQQTDLYSARPRISIVGGH